jgi:hypothetical protein
MTVHYPLREFTVVLIGIAASFSLGFLTIKQLGFLLHFSILVSVLCAICGIAVAMVKRLAITIGALFTLAASIGVFISRPPELKTVRGFVILLGMLGFMPMLITIPLTIHRRTWPPHAK